MAQKEKSPVAQAVRQLREARGESQEQFAIRNGVTVRTIARWESDRPPKDPNLLLRFFEMALDRDWKEVGNIFRDEAICQFRIKFPERFTSLFGVPEDFAPLLNIWKYRLEQDVTASEDAGGIVSASFILPKDLEEPTDETLQHTRTRAEILGRIATAWDDLAPLMRAVEHPDKYADELTAWRIVRREIERKHLGGQPKASDEK